MRGEGQSGDAPAQPSKREVPHHLSGNDIVVRSGSTEATALGGRLPEIVNIANFDPADPPSRILEALACPACRRQEPELADRVTGTEVRIFCDSCGAFVSFSLSDEQADAVRRMAPH